VGGTLVDATAMGGFAGCQIAKSRIMEACMNVRILTLLSAIAAAAALRLLPHPPNFTPIGAMALFSGAYLGRRGAIALVAPLGALFLSDLVLGFYHGMATVYFSTALVVLIGALALQRRSALRIGAAALASSVLFFVLTNFGMWLSSGFYPRTLAGLEACYVAAIPFFQNTVAGDLLFSALLFGGFALLERKVPALRLRTA
jgi:hypothetical protein